MSWRVVGVAVMMVVVAGCGGGEQSVQDKLPDHLKEPPPIEDRATVEAKPAGPINYWSSCPRAKPSPQGVQVNCRDFFLRMDRPVDAGEDTPARTLARHEQAMREQANTMQSEQKPLVVGSASHAALRYVVEAQRARTFGILAVVEDAQGRQRVVQCAVKGAVGVSHCEKILTQALSEGLPEHVRPLAEDVQTSITPRFAGRALVMPRGCAHPSADRIVCEDGTTMIWALRGAATAPGREAKLMSAFEQGMQSRFARVKGKDAACVVGSEKAQACRALSLKSGPDGDGYAWLARGVLKDRRFMLMCAYPARRGKRIPKLCAQLLRSPDRTP